MITPSYGLIATERVLPKLLLDFTTASLDSRVTFTRTTDATHPATYVNSSGVVTPATNNQPRFDYDPVTLACKGLLIEESRSNGVTNSGQINNVNYLTLAVTYASGESITAPDGSVNGSLFRETAATSTHIVYQSFLSVAGTTYTGSVFVKYAGRQWVYVCGHSGAIGVFFDIVNGVVGNSVGGATGTIQNMGNGWFRCCATAVSPTASTFYTQINLATSNGTSTPSYLGDVTKGVYIWGMQREIGAFATSYIPTTTTALTRNADVATMTGTNFSDWFNASEGTFVINGSTFNFTNSDVIVDATDGTTSNRIQMYVAGVTGAATTFMATGGATQAQFSAGTVTANTTFTFASGYKVNAIAASLNAATPATDTSATMPSGINTTTLGCRFNGVNQLNGYLRKVNYYPQRLTNAETQAVSK